MGKSHVPQKCVHCSKLKVRTHKDSNLRLKLILLEKSLRSASDSGQQSSSRQNSPPKSSQDKKMAKKRPASSRLRRHTSSKQSLTTSALSVLAVPWLSTYTSPSFSGTNHMSAATRSGAEAQGFELPPPNAAQLVTNKNQVPTSVTALMSPTTAAVPTPQAPPTMLPVSYFSSPTSRATLAESIAPSSLAATSAQPRAPPAWAAPPASAQSPIHGASPVYSASPFSTASHRTAPVSPPQRPSYRSHSSLSSTRQ